MSVPALASLLKQSAIEDHDEILRAANSTLKTTKNDPQASHVKVVALLKLDRFADAIHAFEAGGSQLKQQAPLEYAYALYKTGKPAEAAEIAAKGSERGYQHVEAQARYRTEDFKRAAELYKILGSRLGDDAEADLKINTGAVDAQLEWNGLGEYAAKKKPAREDMDAFETAYNAACGSIARGEISQGEILLKRARDLCNAVEDMSQEEKDAELLPITVQQVYVLGRQGKTEEAEKMAKSIDVKEVPDASTRYIAQINNAAAAGESSNPYLTQRLVSRDIDSLKPDYPFNFQSAILRRNRLAADLKALKFKGAIDSTATTLSKNPTPTTDASHNSLSVVNAIGHAQGQTGKEGLKHILPLLEKRPTDVGLALTVVQLYTLLGNTSAATTVLETFLTRLENATPAALDVRFGPGLVGTMVSLYAAASRRTKIQSELGAAATHWRNTKDRSPGVLGLLKAAGSVLLESPSAADQTAAREIFADLHSANPEDAYASAGVAASSQSKTLTPINNLISQIDVDALEAAGIAHPPSSSAAVSTRKRPAEEETKPKKAKKIRASHMPKDFDPNKKMDAERWLPLRDRSTYRPKGKKNKARQALLSQGAAASGAESEGSRPATPGGDVVKQKQASGGAKKKAKGKGKR